jgi:hypothetical protein
VVNVLKNNYYLTQRTSYNVGVRVAGTGEMGVGSDRNVLPAASYLTDWEGRKWCGAGGALYFDT